MTGDFVFALVALATIASLLLVWEKSVIGYAGIYATQAACVGMLAVGSAVGEGAGLAILVAALSLIAKSIILPIGLRHFGRRLSVGPKADLILHTPSSILVAFALIVFGFAVLHGIGNDSSGAGGLALGQALVGLWLVASRRSVLSQALGLMVVENGAALLMVLVAGGRNPLIEILLLMEAVAVPVALLLLAGRVRSTFGSTDTGHLKSITESGAEEVGA
ncbi:MAG: hypothetical protein M1335_01880 [Chloroflexi bacterium]|nr:hypothetical protein [Chloroflexota bacterium]